MTRKLPTIALVALLAFGMLSGSLMIFGLAVTWLVFLHLDFK